MNNEAYLCRKCSQEIRETDTVCPNCNTDLSNPESKMPKAKTVNLTDNLTTSNHLMRTQLEEGQPIGFSESESSDLTRGAKVGSDGSIISNLSGKPPQNEQDSDNVCSILINFLNTKGANITLVGRGQADEDLVINYQGKKMGLQVVRAQTDSHFWAELADSKNISQILSVDAAAQDLKAAIEHKTEPGGIPLTQRPGLILVLDTFRLPSRALKPVVEKFQTDFVHWTRSLGFRAVYIVGPEPSFVTRLDENDIFL
jgi:hypothetical protein